MLRSDIKREVYRFPNNAYWGAPNQTRQKAVDFLNELTDISLSHIFEEDVSPTTNHCIDISLSDDSYELLVMIGDTECAILVWCNGKRVTNDIDAMIPNENIVVTMSELAHKVNCLVNNYMTI